VIRPVEQVPNALVTALESERPDYKNIQEIAKDFVTEDSLTFGTALAFEPYMHDAKHYRYCPYFFENRNRIRWENLLFSVAFHVANFICFCAWLIFFIFVRVRRKLRLSKLKSNKQTGS